MAASGDGTPAAVAAVATAAKPKLSGANRSTVRVGKEPIRSVTVSPRGQTSFTCPTGIVPQGTCFIGTRSGGGVQGGVTVTNGTAPSTIVVTGQPAVPRKAGSRSWALVGGTAPGPDQFAEFVDGGGVIATQLSTVPRCDDAFDAGSPQCLAAPNAIRQESLQIIGPSYSTSTGLFTITTTWTALPPA